LGFLLTLIHPLFLWVIQEVYIGGIIAVLAIAVRKELLIPLLCGVFF
jgi:phospho-N-acetylmuramoyl-pentapeptide-transferase